LKDGLKAIKKKVSC